MNLIVSYKLSGVAVKARQSTVHRLERCPPSYVAWRAAMATNLSKVSLKLPPQDSSIHNPKTKRELLNLPTNKLVFAQRTKKKKPYSCIFQPTNISVECFTVLEKTTKNINIGALSALDFKLHLKINERE
jgi:hypothetical protein